MRKLYLLLIITFFSCTENKLSINKETILKYNIVSEYGDIADTLNVYFEKSFETKLNVSNLKKNKSIVLITKPNIENDFISIQLKDSLITISSNNKKNLFYATYEFIEKFLNVGRHLAIDLPKCIPNIDPEEVVSTHTTGTTGVIAIAPFLGSTSVGIAFAVLGPFRSHAQAPIKRRRNPWV